MSNNEGVMDALSEVIDPEMGISVTDLGLIYGVENQEGHLEVTMTLTSPGCPVAPEIMAAVHRAALSVDEVESVHVNLTFSPPMGPQSTCDGGCPDGIRSVLRVRPHRLRP